MSALTPEQMTDSPVVDRDGQKLGKVADVYVDQQTGRPEWILVQTGLFGKMETFVPSVGAITQKYAIQVPLRTLRIGSLGHSHGPRQRPVTPDRSGPWRGRRRHDPLGRRAAGGHRPAAVRTRPVEKVRGHRAGDP